MVSLVALATAGVALEVSGKVAGVVHGTSSARRGGVHGVAVGSSRLDIELLALVPGSTARDLSTPSEGGLCLCLSLSEGLLSLLVELDLDPRSGFGGEVQCRLRCFESALSAIVSSGA